MPPIDDNLPPAKRAHPPKKLHSTSDFVCENSSAVFYPPEIEARPTDRPTMPLPDSASLLLWILVLGLLLGAAAKSDGEIEEEERASGNKKKSGKLCELANLRRTLNFGKRQKGLNLQKAVTYRVLCSALFKDVSLTFSPCSQHLQHCEVRCQALNIWSGIVDILYSFRIFPLQVPQRALLPRRCAERHLLHHGGVRPEGRDQRGNLRGRSWRLLHK